MITMQMAEARIAAATAELEEANKASQRASKALRDAHTLRKVARVWEELMKLPPLQQKGALAELRRIADAPHQHVDHEKSQIPYGFALYTVSNNMYILDAPISNSIHHKGHHLNDVGRAFLDYLDQNGPGTP